MSRGLPRLLILSLLFLTTCIQESIGAISCQDEYGRPLDWFVVYSFPTRVSDGLKYAYITSNDVRTGWIESIRKIDDVSSLLGRTINAALHGQNPLRKFYSYNDNLGSGANSYYAHTKGFIAYTHSNSGYPATGVWISHSIPGLAPGSQTQPSYIYPANGKRNGQVAFCFSLRANTENEYANMEADIQTYIRTVNPQCTTMPCLGSKINLIDQAFNESRVINNNIPIRASVIRGLYARNRQGDDDPVDLYETILGQSYAQTHRPRAVGNVVRNVYDIRMKANSNVGATIYDWDSSVDHSKWAVKGYRENSADQLMCVGDLNRCPTNLRRYGGVICFENNALRNHFRNMVLTYGGEPTEKNQTAVEGEDECCDDDCGE